MRVHLLVRQMQDAHRWLELVVSMAIVLHLSQTVLFVRSKTNVHPVIVIAAYASLKLMVEYAHQAASAAQTIV